MEDSADKPTKQRGLGTWGDMVRSMGLILVVVGAMLAVTWQPAPDQAVHTVDLNSIAVGAAKRADFAPLVPALPNQWSATSARLEPAADDASHFSWHIGYVSPSGAYFALEQSSTVLVSKFVADWTQGMQPAALPGSPAGWAYYIDDQGNTAVVINAPDSTIVLLGPETPDAQTFRAQVAAGLGS